MQMRLRKSLLLVRVLWLKFWSRKHEFEWVEIWISIWTGVYFQSIEGDDQVVSHGEKLVVFCWDLSPTLYGCYKKGLSWIEGCEG